MILGTEFNEFITNRQNSKIQYLQQENDQLSEFVRDLENALRLNKEALKLAVDQCQTSRKNPSNSLVGTSMATTNISDNGSVDNS